jgi:hypothetical protein
MAIQKNTPALLKKVGKSYSCIINATMDLIKDPATLGIFIYLQSKPATWVIREKELMTRFGRGRDYIRARLKELRDVGLLASKSTRNEKTGQIIGWTTILYSHLSTESDENESPVSENKSKKTASQKAKKKQAEETIKLEGDSTGASTLLANPTHIKERLSLVKKETTTTTLKTEVEVIISEEIDKQIIEIRDEHMPTDERDKDEFLKQCKWHLDNGDTKKYNYAQRIAGLKKIIRNKSFQTPAAYPAAKKSSAVSEEVLMSQYKNFCHSWVEEDLRKRGHQTMTFDEWKQKRA